MKNHSPLLSSIDPDAYIGQVMPQNLPQIEAEKKKLSPEELWHVINEKLIPQGAD